MNVQAETVYEAVALVMAAFGEHHCLPGPGEHDGGRGPEPGGDSHREHGQGAGLVGRVRQEPAREDHEGAVEGDDGVVKVCGQPPRLACADHASGSQGLMSAQCDPENDLQNLQSSDEGTERAHYHKKRKRKCPKCGRVRMQGHGPASKHQKQPEE